MKKVLAILLLGAVLASGIGAFVVSAAAENTQNSWYGPMHDWRNFRTGSMMGHGYGPYTGEGAGITVKDADAAADLAEAYLGFEVTAENIYPMGRWWIVQYTDDDAVKQLAIEAFTGDVYEDFAPGYGRQAYVPGQGKGSWTGMSYRMPCFR